MQAVDGVVEAGVEAATAARMRRSIGAGTNQGQYPFELSLATLGFRRKPGIHPIEHFPAGQGLWPQRVKFVQMTVSASVRFTLEPGRPDASENAHACHVWRSESPTWASLPVL